MLATSSSRMPSLGSLSAVDVMAAPGAIGRCRIDRWDGLAAAREDLDCRVVADAVVVDILSVGVSRTETEPSPGCGSLARRRQRLGCCRCVRGWPGWLEKPAECRYSSEKLQGAAGLASRLPAAGCRWWCELAAENLRL